MLRHDPASVHPSLRAVGTRVLSYRGHLREALTEAKRWQDAKLAPIAARLGIIPADTADAVFAAWLAAELPRASQALPWWAWRQDTSALRAFVRWQQRGAESETEPELRSLHRFWANAGRGFAALARRDSAEALRWLALAPDSTCAACLEVRLARAQLLAADGRPQEAAQILEDAPRWIDISPAPVEVLWALEDGRVAERLGDWRRAGAAYKLVADAWRQADPELQALAQEARDGLARSAGQR